MLAQVVDSPVRVGLIGTGWAVKVGSCGVEQPCVGTAVFLKAKCPPRAPHVSASHSKLSAETGLKSTARFVCAGPAATVSTRGVAGNSHLLSQHGPRNHVGCRGAVLSLLRAPSQSITGPLCAGCPCDTACAARSITCRTPLMMWTPSAGPQRVHCVAHGIVPAHFVPV